MSTAQPIGGAEVSSPHPPLVQDGADWWSPLCVGCAAALALAGLALFALTEWWIGAPGEAATGPTGTAAQALLLGLGLAAASATAIALFHEGTLRTPRSRLRLSAIGIWFSIAVVDNAWLAPALRSAASSEALVAMLAELRAARVGVLALAWMAAGLVVTAHRAPRMRALTTANGLTPRHRSLLFLVGAATFFHGYDTMIPTLALPYIGRDLGAGEGALGLALAALRLGALAAIAAGRLADRLGRRRLLLVSIVLYTLATAATATSRSLGEFVAYQVVAQVFLAAELVVAQVVIAEAFPARSRGHGLGLLFAFAGLGAGLAALLFPLFQGSAIGWRGLYFVGLAPLLGLAWLRRGLPESERWERVAGPARERSRWTHLFAPALRRPLIGLTIPSLCGTAVIGASFGFVSHHVTTRLGWQPAEVTALVIGAGAVGFSANFVAGRFADRAGRRILGIFGIVGAALAALAIYATPWIVPGFAALTFCDASFTIAAAALFTESFPTQLRATARAWGHAASVVGALSGLAAVGLFADLAGGAPRVIVALALVSFAGVPGLLIVRETLGRPLHEIGTALRGVPRD